MSVAASQTINLQNTLNSKTQVQKKKKNMINEMSEEDKYLNAQIIQKMNKRINYLKNPRFKENKRPVMYSDMLYRQELIKPSNNQESSFRAFPQQVIFRDYMINHVYEIELRLTNVSQVLKRVKFMPPFKPEFSIGGFRYPAKEEGYIAPGMSLYLQVRFNPSSFAEFDDELAVLTEENIFKIPILARKEPPCLDLPENLDCKSCWLGDQIDVRFKVTNTGGEAGYRFFKQEKGEEANSDFLQIGSFLVAPIEFFLQKNESQEISVLFRPDHEGETLEDVVLGCDNQTNASLKLIGKGNTVELGIAAVDENSLENVKVNNLNEATEQILEPFTKIFFKNAIPNQVSSRKLKIRNRRSVKVKYHWSLFKGDQTQLVLGDEDDKFYFHINPSEGVFQPDEIVEFLITLQSEQYYPLFEYANLIIDEIPIEAIKTQDTSKQQPEQYQGGHQAFGSNSIRPSITYFEFELISFSSLCELSIEPPFYIFSTPLSVSEIYKKNFIISNPSKCTLNYKVSVSQTSSNQMMTHIGQVQGTILPGNEIELQLGIGSQIVGKNQKVIYRVDFDYCSSYSIEIIASFESAKIAVSEPMLNLGLIKSNSQKEVQIHVVNLSGVTAVVDVQSESNSPKLTFHPDVLEILPNNTMSLTVKLITTEPETFKDFLILQVRGGDSTVLDVFAEIQSPSVSLNSILLDIDILYSGNTYTFDERAQQHIVLQNLGNIPTPFKWEVPLDQSRYLVQFDPQKGILKPKTNLPIKFSIKPKQGGQVNEIFVCDIEGLQYPLGFELKTKVLGLSVEYELIEEDQGTGEALDNKSSSVKSIKKSPESTPSSKRKSFFRQSFLNKTGGSKGSYKSRRTQVDFEEEKETAIKTQKMDHLDFFNCTISKPKEMKFLLKNVSGIHTQYRFFMETFEAYNGDENQATNEDFEGTKSVQTKSIRFASENQSRGVDGKSSNSRSIVKKGKITQDGKPTVLLTDRIEKTRNFTSVAGQQLNHQKKLETDQRLYLSNNLGIAIVCEPKKGSLPAYGSVVVTITAFNDICGLFKDNLCVEVRGLDLVKFPVVVDIKGSPIVVTPNQLGVSYNEEIPTFNMGTYMRNSGSIARDFRVTNTGPKDIELDWVCYNLGGGGNQENQQNFFNIRIVDPPLGSSNVCQVQFLAQEPKEATEGPFIIQPKKEKIRGRKEKHFTVNFQTGQSGVYNAVIVAQPKLYLKNTEETNAVQEPLGIISLYLQGETLQPYLYLDKLQRTDDTHLIKFQQWTSGHNKRQEKTICLVNKQKSGFVCTIQLEGPFRFLKTTTNSPQKYELQSAQSLKEGPQTTFNLVQNSHIEMLIKFEGPQSSNFEEWPMSYKNYKHGVLKVFYANGDSQQFSLEGILLRPYVHLNTSGIQNVEGASTLEFGVVHINNKKTLQVHVSNLCAVPAQWKLNYVKFPVKRNLIEQTMTFQDKEDQQKTDDPSVFEFQISEGVLEGPSTMVHTLPHASALPHSVTLKEIYDLGIEPQKILINFRPKKNILYKSKYRITVQDGPAVEFIVKGTGTYDENLEKANNPL